MCNCDFGDGKQDGWNHLREKVSWDVWDERGVRGCCLNTMKEDVISLQDVGVDIIYNMCDAIRLKESTVRNKIMDLNKTNRNIK